ncbi:hypothetical protein BX616_004676 [Lobosporangium transversale]|nr:hypothetical protein BX616_004676 [Lobosporangium transversale]
MVGAAPLVKDGLGGGTRKTLVARQNPNEDLNSGYYIIRDPDGSGNLAEGKIEGDLERKEVPPPELGLSCKNEHSANGVYEVECIGEEWAAYIECEKKRYMMPFYTGSFIATVFCPPNNVTEASGYTTK